MATSNRQNGAVENNGRTLVHISSERVAMVANVKKVGCNEFTTQEWIELITIALAHAKCHFKYLPFFLPVSGGKINCFSFSRGEYVHGEFREEKLSIDPLAFTLYDFSRNVKAIQICEVSEPTDTRLSVKFLLNSHGVFYRACCRRLGSNVLEAAEIYRVDISMINQDVMKVALDAYPQIGPNILFAISLMHAKTYEKKLGHLTNIKFASDKLAAICANVDVGCDHYVQIYPFGVSDGSEKH